MGKVPYLMQNRNVMVEMCQALQIPHFYHGQIAKENMEWLLKNIHLAEGKLLYYLSKN